MYYYYWIKNWIKNVKMYVILKEFFNWVYLVDKLSK